MPEQYEHSEPKRHGTKEMVTHLTGKHKAKSEALKKKKEYKGHPNGGGHKYEGGKCMDCGAKR